MACKRLLGKSMREREQGSFKNQEGKGWKTVWVQVSGLFCV